jgi:hypothetical protein
MLFTFKKQLLEVAFLKAGAVKRIFIIFFNNILKFSGEVPIINMIDMVAASHSNSS